MKQCEVCEAADTDTEAVLFPTDVARLFALLEHHAGDTAAWPSVWICRDCEAATRDVFRELAELPPAVLVLISCDTLREICRLATGRPGCRWWASTRRR